MVGSILPSNSTDFEIALANSGNFNGNIDDAIGEISRAKHISRPASFLPWLVDEYGLGELTPYVPNLYDLLDEGIEWQRIRGSLASIDMGLNWIGYSAYFEAAWPHRNWWNSFQLKLDKLPANDAPDLERIEGITDLSKCARSDFRRAVYQYDVGALEADHTRLDNSMLERESGVIATEKNTLWSFGRTTEITHILTEEEGEAIGNWIAPVTGSAKWTTMNYPWSTAHFPWASIGEMQRNALMSAWFEERVLFLALYKNDDSVIGYRRCRAVHAVEQKYEGSYSHTGNTFSLSENGNAVYIEAMTDFNCADNIEATSLAIIVNAECTSSIPAGRLWLQPSDLISGTEIIKTPINITLRKTVRDQFKILLRF